MDSRSAALGFAAGAALGAGALYLYTRSQRCQQTAAPPDSAAAAQQLASAGGAALPGAAAAAALHSPIDMSCFEQDEILEEQLTRNVQFFGLEAQKRIGGSFVVVVGLGGVGSHAAHLLLRSGVGRLRLIDFDQVTLSTLNRHCLATRADVGTPKATCLAQHFADIVPEAHVEALVEMYTPEAEERLLGGNPDFVLDAIDNIDTKVALLAACKRHGIPVLASAGAGAKADPTRLRILDVAESVADPLARSVRHRLRRDYSIESGVPIVLSTERPRMGLVYHAGEGANLLDYQVVPNFRVGTIPVLGTTPAIFGLACAAYILCQLAGQPIAPEPHFRVPPKQFQGIFDSLYEREELRFGSADGIGVDAEEVEALVKDVWHGYSARAPHPPGHDKGITRSVGHLTLTRWDPAKPATIDNLVLLTHAEADDHDQLQNLDDVRQQEPELCARVEATLARAKRDFWWRI
ncbi:NAD(P)-binding Rossmann-fold superfamily isoform 1 [Chlorella sorokiniana]|uniref:NAD(P)-binding Rossmann-fold superfamily isoform 1 n=1 Tax=Chlorella sorokiniana TaxID=3076 RepID=A0A2P6TNV0_CHLSO|nr:NAD(P)-binding Rossmann-fold superfamily isoform 1 [Chlorella sorokiniana]|eukprot:PRW51003.1 NAD(P)-binding Rossmann-fold superfamily isoform 1 [Chlorella sorokiniana]